MQIQRQVVISEADYRALPDELVHKLYVDGQRRGLRFTDENGKPVEGYMGLRAIILDLFQEVLQVPPI